MFVPALSSSFDFSVNISPDFNSPKTSCLPLILNPAFTSIHCMEFAQIFRLNFFSSICNNRNSFEPAGFIFYNLYSHQPNFLQSYEDILEKSCKGLFKNHSGCLILVKCTSIRLCGLAISYHASSQLTAGEIHNNLNHANHAPRTSEK